MQKLLALARHNLLDYSSCFFIVTLCYITNCIEIEVDALLENDGVHKQLKHKTQSKLVDGQQLYTDMYGLASREENFMRETEVLRFGLVNESGREPMSPRQNIFNGPSCNILVVLGLSDVTFLDFWKPMLIVAETFERENRFCFTKTRAADIKAAYRTCRLLLTASSAT